MSISQGLICLLILFVIIIVYYIARGIDYEWDNLDEQEYPGP
jgi:hypothetical protein